MDVERARTRSRVCLGYPYPAPDHPTKSDALMSDYYYGLEFLKASTDVYKTVFPWLSERLEVSLAFFFSARLGTVARGRGDEQFRNYLHSLNLCDML